MVLDLGTGDWGQGAGSRGRQGRQGRHIYPNAQCPMTAVATSRETRPSHCLPNAPCPMPHTLNPNYAKYNSKSDVLELL
ncbi:MAG: hypothetical protein ACRAVC_14660 [Trichormus sp.]